jgi:hypothetical protein
MKAKNVMFVVVPSTSRNYGYSIQAPADVTWAKGPGNTFGWYRRKRDAQRRCDELNGGTAFNLGQMEAKRNRHV